MYGMQSIPVKIGNRHKKADTVTSTACPDCNGDMGRKNYCKSCGKEHDSANLLSAIRVTKDEKHIFTKDEVNALKESDNIIEVIGKIAKSDIDISRINKSWIVIPDSDKKGAKTKPWEMLRRALESDDNAIVCKVYNRGSEQLGIMSADIRSIVMYGIVFEDEYHSFDVYIEKVELSKDEEQMGVSFVKSLKGVEIPTIENKTRIKLIELTKGKPLISTIKSTSDDLSFFK